MDIIKLKNRIKTTYFDYQRLKNAISGQKNKRRFIGQLTAKKLNEYNTLLIDFYKFGKFQTVKDFYNNCHQEIYKDWKMEFPTK